MRVLVLCGLLAVQFAAVRAEAQGGREGGSVAGVVRDSLGAGLSAAAVSVASGRPRTTTDEQGRFRLDGVPAGEHVLTIRRLGFRPETVTVVVTGGAPAALEVFLAAAPTHLTPVVVRERAAVFDARLAGFNARRERGVGHFVTRERIDAAHSQRFIDILREVPGVRVGTLRGEGRVRMRGASCDPLVFIDGFPAAAGAVDLDMIDLNLVEGIEVYSGLASIPPEFVSVRGQERCGVLAIWTQPHRARASSASRGRGTDLERLVSERRVHTAEDVDVPARLEDGSAVPVYPDSLWRARVPGRVVIELIVGTDGRFEPGTFRVVSSTHASFTSAVRVALNEARFTAGTRGGRPVRQLIQLPFEFAADALPAAPLARPPANDEAFELATP